MMTAGIRYRFLDAALIRLAVAPGGGTLPAWPDLTGDTPAHVSGWRDWLQQIWKQEEIVEAIELAAPDLARRVDAVRTGNATRPRRVRRAVESVVRYLLRMHARATPFGLFAGVAPVHISETASTSVSGSASAVARPDAAWLNAVVTDLENHPDVLRRLRVVANNLGFARDGRWVLAWQQQPEGGGQAGVGEVSLRHTRAVRLTLDAARSPVTVADLIDKLAAELPGTAPEKIERMVATLVAQRVLITDLHPPMAATDPLGHVIERLAEAVPTADPVARLREVRAHLAQYGQAATPRQRRTLHDAATAAIGRLRAQPRPQLAVDLRAGESVQLPRAVAREAESAAAALVRLSPHPVGNPAWIDYHARFLEGYGSGAVVPLTELTNASSGLGFPAGYRDEPAPPLSSADSERDRSLLRLAQQAALDREREVVLDDRRLHELAPRTSGEAVDAAPHTELRFHVHATSTQALDQGEFALVVAGAARQAGTLSGRFLHLLEPPDRERVTRELGRLPGLVSGAQLAQISAPPLAVRTHNVARAPAVFPQISLGEHPAESPDHIALEDLAVLGDDRRLSLISLSRGCVVEPVMLNAVEFRHATHPLARFVAEVGTARASSCKPFAWGMAESLPFLPRLRYGRTVLAPARWSLAATDLPSPQAPWPQWEKAWSRLRRRLGVPDTVLLGEDDRRMRLDLDEPAHLALLRRHVDNAEAAELVEAPGVGEYGWINGRAHEIVLPMAAAPTAAPASRERPARPTRHPGHAPGASPWVYAQLYADPARHDAVLTDHLPALLTDWHEGPPGAWWFLRYREPEPHLRIRLRLHDAEHYGAAVQRLGTWAEYVRSRGLLRHLVLDTYHPEVGRYGTGAALHAAENVFATDSAAVLAQLAASARGGAHRQALTAVSLFDLVAAFTGDDDRGAQWLIAHPPPRPAGDPPREVRDQALRLANPDHGAAALRSLPDGANLMQVWENRRAALAAYRARLEESGGPQADHVLSSLLHLHHVRMADIAPQSERACLRLARAAALARQARSERSPAFPL